MIQESKFEWKSIKDYPICTCGSSAYTDTCRLRSFRFKKLDKEVCIPGIIVEKGMIVDPLGAPSGYSVEDVHFWSYMPE